MRFFIAGLKQDIVSMDASMLVWRVRYELPAELREARMRVYHAVARMLPPRLVYWSFIVATAHATSGRYSGTIVPELSAMDALQRYGNDHRIR